MNISTGEEKYQVDCIIKLEFHSLWSRVVEVEIIYHWKFFATKETFCAGISKSPTNHKKSTFPKGIEKIKYDVS